jgi:Na+/melibiose symporter-like transporter
MIKEIYGYIVGAGVAIASFIAYTFKIKHDAKKELREEIQRKKEQDFRNALEEKIKRDKEINNLSDDELINELSKYSKDYRK